MAKMKYKPVQNFVNGKFVKSAGNRELDVYSPLNGQVISSVALSSATDLDKAVQAAKKAFLGWNAVTIKSRVQVFYRYKRLLEKNIKELAELIHIEHGKTVEEAAAEIEKAVEITEFACSLPQIAGGETLEVSRGVECRLKRVPLGVGASIVPFNFPSMVPHWTIPISIALGNCFILKPSEQVPLSAARTGELLKKAGLPDGVFNIVNGAREIVEAICDHPDISAVTFVGSSAVAKIVYTRASSNFKRALCLGQAKNHIFLLPDSRVEMSAKNIVASFAGCTGERCMAASVLVAVGPVDKLIKAICAEGRKIIPGKNMGPVISEKARASITDYIDEAEKEGAKVILDGRNMTGKGNKKGYYIGPTIIDNVKPDMRIAREEVFGPVLSVIRVKNIKEGIKIENASPYGNAASVFTQDGEFARRVVENVSAGMVGVNIGVPVPREPFPFGGWNESKFGVEDITGKSSIEFWTENKKITTKWNPEAGANWMS